MRWGSADRPSFVPTAPACAEDLSQLHIWGSCSQGCLGCNIALFLTGGLASSVSHNADGHHCTLGEEGG